MILSQFEETVWHRRSSDGDVAEPRHHGGEIVASVEPVFEFGEVAGHMLLAIRKCAVRPGGLPRCAIARLLPAYRGFPVWDSFVLQGDFYGSTLRQIDHWN